MVDDSPKHILLVFLDGVGLGDDTKTNPFSDHPLPFLTPLFDGQKLLKKKSWLSE